MSFKREDIQRFCVLISGDPDILNYNFQSSAKAEIWDLTICIVVNGKNSKSHSDLDLERTIIPNVELV